MIRFLVASFLWIFTWVDDSFLFIVGFLNFSFCSAAIISGIVPQYQWFRTAEYRLVSDAQRTRTLRRRYENVDLDDRTYIVLKRVTMPMRLEDVIIGWCKLVSRRLQVHSALRTTCFMELLMPDFEHLGFMMVQLYYARVRTRPLES